MHRHDQHFAQHWFQWEFCHLEGEEETTIASLRKLHLDLATGDTSEQTTGGLPEHDDVGCLSLSEDIAVFISQRNPNDMHVTKNVTTVVVGGNFADIF